MCILASTPSARAAVTAYPPSIRPNPNSVPIRVVLRCPAEGQTHTRPLKHDPTLAFTLHHHYSQTHANTQSHAHTYDSEYISYRILTYRSIKFVDIYLAVLYPMWIYRQTDRASSFTRTDLLPG